MPPDVTCPECQHGLPAVYGPVCPRCGAALPRTQIRPPQGDIRKAPRAAAPLPTVPCPACGKEVAQVCLICPHCGEALRGRYSIHLEGAGREAPRAPSGVLLAWAAVGAISMVLWIGAGLAALSAVLKGALSDATGIIFLCGAVLLLGVIVVVPLWVGIRSRGVISWRLYLVYTLAGFGCLFPAAFVAGCFLSCVGVR